MTGVDPAQALIGLGLGLILLGVGVIQHARGRRDTHRVLQVIASEPGEEHYAYRLAKRTGLAPSAVQPALTALEVRGWVTARWEAEAALLGTAAWPPKCPNCERAERESR